MKSKIYFGKIKHRRFSPQTHQLNYNLFMLYIDLDELPKLFNSFWLWSKDRKNLARFKTNDYLCDSQGDIKQGVANEVKKSHNVGLNGPIRMLTHLRYFGYCFNPVTFYYCFDSSDNHVEFVVAQVSNTPWNQRHCYVLDNRKKNLKFEDSKIIHGDFVKNFHVSPFLPMDMDYQWKLSFPEKKLSVFIENYKNDKKVFDATLVMQSQEISSASLAKALIKFPLMTIKIILAIYWNALILWLKGAKYHSNLSSSN